MLILFGLSCLTGCNQDDISLHQAHIYKGKTDQSKIDTQQLATRFKRVQTDR